MSWSRGFLRLWLALSVCYILIVVSVLGLDKFRPLVRPSATYEIEFSGGTVRSFDTSNSRAELLQEASSAYKADAAVFSSKGKPVDADEIVNNVKKHSEALVMDLRARNDIRKSDAYTALAAAIVPPLCLLGIGVVIGWVAVGFRRSSAQVKR
jgi:hypothetical protein